MEDSSGYVLFGAGTTGMAALRYYGSDKVNAVIDNDAQKVGSIYEGIPVISFDAYLKDYKNYTIIISIYSKYYFECVEQIKMHGITNYFTSPPVLYGLDSPEQFAENNNLLEYSRVVSYRNNPITERIEKYIIKQGGILIAYIDNGLCEIEMNKNVIELEDLNGNDILVLTTNEMEKPIRNMIKTRFYGKIADIYRYQELRKEKYLYLQRYKNIYEGKRCFIIGNGPSLRKEDLMVLEQKREISFAANGIFHIYNEISWRPTHYVLCDALAYKAMYERIKDIENKDAFIADFYYTDFGTINKANRYYLINKLSDSDKFEFSDDAVRGFYSGKTVTYVMIQMACYMGIKEIYLLGVDWSGGTEGPRKDFYESDKEDRTVCNNPYNLFIEEMNAFKSAKKYAELNGIKIYNATRGGRLEVFERVDFDSLFVLNK